MLPFAVECGETVPADCGSTAEISYCLAAVGTAKAAALPAPPSGQALVQPPLALCRVARRWQILLSTAQLRWGVPNHLSGLGAWIPAVLGRLV